MQQQNHWKYGLNLQVRAYMQTFSFGLLSKNKNMIYAKTQLKLWDQIKLRRIRIDVESGHSEQ